LKISSLFYRILNSILKNYIYTFRKNSFLGELINNFYRYKNRVDIFTEIELDKIKYYNYIMIIIQNIILLVYYEIKVNSDTSDNLEEQFQLTVLHIKDPSNLKYLDEKTITEGNKIVAYVTIAFLSLQLLLYMIYLFNKFKISFWIKYYTSKNLNFYVNKKDDSDEDNSEKITPFEDKKKKVKDK